MSATSTVSAKKLRANRRNARRSTGPRTGAGKRKSSRNATTHGLFCHELVLAGESHELFRGIRQGFIASLKPQNLVELLIVDRLAAATWKLRRLQSAEQVMYSVGEQEMLEHREEAAQKVAEDLNELAGEDDEVVDATKIAESLQRAGVPPHVVLGEQFGHRWDQSFDRLARYEQRLDYQIQRCLRELRQLRKDSEKIESLPRSPFLEPALVEASRVEEEDEGETASPRPREEPEPRARSNMQNEPTAVAGGLTNGPAKDNGATGIPRLRPDAGPNAFAGEGGANGDTTPV